MILDAEGMQAGKGRQGIGHLGEGGGLGAARKGAETPGDHLAADVRASSAQQAASESSTASLRTKAASASIICG